MNHVAAEHGFLVVQIRRLVLDVSARRAVLKVAHGEQARKLLDEGPRLIPDSARLRELRASIPKRPGSVDSTTFLVKREALPAPTGIHANPKGVRLRLLSHRSAMSLVKNAY